MTAAFAARQTDHPVDPIFPDRWSPRAFTGEPIPVETLMSLFEAARWSPSAFNAQPWRFVWGRRGTPAFATMLDLLMGFNRTWCEKASALVVLASAESAVPPGKTEAAPSYSHSLDAGAAWMAFSLQARRLGWHTHGMTGLNLAEAAAALAIPTGFRVEMAFAVGRKGDPADLPEGLRAREVPSGRKPLADIAAEGRFPGA